MSKSKNDIAWEKLFEKYNILPTIIEQGAFQISSLAINEFREARLMTKFDFRSQLPKIFAQNNLSILPISRGTYIIAAFDTFQDFESNEVAIQKIEFPRHIESIDYNSITSEATALNCAYISGIINDFTNDEALKPTVNGRMGSGKFEFSIRTQTTPIPIQVENSQLEIDGGFEGTHFLSLVEAKNSISKDFLIRQLFYPFRLWREKISKPIKNLFLTYTNGVFHFREYVFEDANDYNSIQLIKEKKYIIEDFSINLEVIQQTLDEVKLVPEPKIPFPQADSFERIINLCELLYDNDSLTRESITENYDFNQRQTNYYTDAGRYLGLIEKNTVGGEIHFKLTPAGKKLFRLSIFKRQLKFIECILSHQAFNLALRLYLKKTTKPSKWEIVEIMKKSNLYNINSEATYERRAATISSWLDWILSLAQRANPTQLNFPF